ncbi:MAG: lysophospholipid acyltransferase family protein [Acidimicrobiales bacterium]|nr:lysophospholipid acyltransferase family protein [Acidimicrobiales bacterium]
MPESSAGADADWKYHTDQVGRPPTRGELAFYRVFRNLLVWFCQLFWRLEVTGREHVPAGPFVLCGVHRSNVDSPVVAAVTKRRMRFMGKHTMWKYRLPGRFFTAMGGFGVNRETADREALKTCIAVLEGGEPLVMFPEGTRRSGPVVEDLYEGPAFVAARARVPILPVGIGGSEDAMPRGAKYLRPVKISLVVGPPIPAPAGPEGKRPARRQIHETTEQLRVTLQELFDDAQKRIGKPNRYQPGSLAER